MGANSEKLLRTLEIIRETDEQHPITSAKIADKLMDDYGLSSERKAVQRYIQDLVSCDYDIIQHPDNKLGYYLAGREFEDWELKVLMDAVQSAKFLSQSDTDAIIAKLSMLASADSRRTLKLMTVPADSKRGDREVKHSIDTVLQAMRKHRKIHFEYMYTDDDMQRTRKHPDGTKPVSPYALIWRKDKYYLVGSYSEESALSYYRLDRISAPEILEEEIAVPLEALLGSNAEQKLREFIKRNIYTKKGTPITLLLEVRTNGVDTLWDSFGEEVRVKNNGDGTLEATVNAADSEGLYTWLMHHGREVVVLRPQYVRDEMKKRLSVMLDNYS